MELSKKSEQVSISLPSYLVEIMTHYCEENDFTVSGLIQRALKKYLSSHLDSKKVWETIYDEIRKE